VEDRKRRAKIYFERGLEMLKCPSCFICWLREEVDVAYDWQRIETPEYSELFQSY